MDNKPTVSVCIPAFEAERHLGATIESVLDQSFTDWEMIVLDNNSSDGTAALARSYTDPRIQVFQRDTTVPVAANWNDVAARAQGRYLKLLCADDLLGPGCLAAEVEIVNRYPDVSLVASRRDFVNEDGEVILRGQGLRGLVGLQESDVVVRHVVRSGMNPIGWPSALLFRLDQFRSIGGFRGDWVHPMDLELAVRLLRSGSFYGIDQAHAAFRIRHDSLSMTLTGQSAQHRAVLRSVAADPYWRIDRATLWLGLARTRVETVKKILLFRAAQSRLGLVRRLPALVRHAPRTT